MLTSYLNVVSVSRILTWILINIGCCQPRKICHPWVVDTGPGATTGGRLLGADRLLLLLGARGRAVASSAVVATRGPLSTAATPAVAIVVGGLRAASAPGARVGRG